MRGVGWHTPPQKWLRERAAGRQPGRAALGTQQRVLSSPSAANGHFLSTSRIYDSVTSGRDSLAFKSPQSSTAPPGLPMRMGSILLRAAVLLPLLIGLEAANYGELAGSEAVGVPTNHIFIGVGILRQLPLRPNS